MLVSFLKLVHIISAMVYFGLPFTFGRWYGSASNSGNLDQFTFALGKILNFVRIHMTLSAVITTGTGIALAVIGGWWQSATWPHFALLLMVLSLANLLLFLRPALNRVRKVKGSDDPLIAATRVRIAIFSALHHTLVTLIDPYCIFPVVDSCPDYCSDAGIHARGIAP